MTALQSRAFLASCLAADRMFNGRISVTAAAAYLSQCGVFPSAEKAESYLKDGGRFVTAADTQSGIENGEVEYTNIATALRSQ